MLNKNSVVLALGLLAALGCSETLELRNQQDLSKATCLTDLAMAEHFALNPESKANLEQFEQFTAQYISKKNTDGRIAAGSYVIPVVFHVYGTDFAGKTVNDNTIITALQKVNEDFHGLNDDFASVDPFFHTIRSTFDVTFKLATKDPQGNPTTGIIYHPAAKGFGGTKPTAIKAIKADAWNNYKYCNVYIQLDLYGNNQLNNSGVAWYPDKAMSDNNTARIVYNGRYLYGNTDKEFSSTLSHEFGHYLNLIHSFDGGCSVANESACATTGDKVCDTPQATIDDTCSTLNNCAGKRVNVENYMGYAGARGCYKMFTTGQVNRMDAAMQHVARVTLWQAGNLTATGVQ